MADKYILDMNGEPQPVGLIEWARWMESGDDARRVARDQIGEVDVSTVFLGVDHNFGVGAPILFETMVFGGEHDQYQDRYATKADAVVGHAKVCALVRGEAQR